MSASREKKARQELGTDYVSPKEQKARQEAKDNRRSTAIFTICAVLFLVFVIGMAVYKSGVIQRNAAAVRVGDETFTAADMSYYYYNTRSTTLSSLSSIIDTNKSLREQSSFSEGQTWFDFVAAQAAQTLAQTATVAKAADAAGFDGGEDIENTVSDAIASLKSAAEAYGYSTNQYLKAVYGPLMTLDTFERNMRLSAIAEAYSSHLADPANFSDEEINATLEADPAKYDVVAVRHILVEDQETAENLLKQWREGEATEESFAELAKENTTDTGSAENGGLYENVTQGQMVTEFNDWCFDEARESGDVDIVQTTYGYHIMYFVSRDRSPDWKTMVVNELASEVISKLTEGVAPELLSGMKYIEN